MDRFVRVVAHVPEHDTHIEGILGMVTRKDEATDTYLGFMPALKLYSQGRTPQEADRLMEKVVTLYLETAVRQGQLGEILLARGFRRATGGEKPTEVLFIRSISGRPKVGSEEPDMELELAGAN